MSVPKNALNSFLTTSLSAGKQGHFGIADTNAVLLTLMSICYPAAAYRKLGIRRELTPLLMKYCEQISQNSLALMVMEAQP
jgi:hypothetical protein